VWRCRKAPLPTVTLRTVGILYRFTSAFCNGGVTDGLKSETMRVQPVLHRSHATLAGLCLTKTVVITRLGHRRGAQGASVSPGFKFRLHRVWGPPFFAVGVREGGQKGGGGGGKALRRPPSAVRRPPSAVQTASADRQADGGERRPCGITFGGGPPTAFRRRGCRTCRPAVGRKIRARSPACVRA
jgi:hypothetical protein